MAYTVLARRYRSGTFDEVIGQDHVAQTLKKAIASGRIAHAYLFCGTRGTGKTSMARILAKALNCHAFAGPTTEPCGKCDSCLRIAKGDDIDVIEIDAASNTGVDNVREVIENSQYRPARSRFKIYIIDEAHMLSKQAFNALLKTLEEPPSHVKFILATTEPEKLLPTILSRCQRYDFRNIPTREIAAHLADICKREEMVADEDALLLVAKAGAGSMRDSLSLLDRLLSVGEKRLTADMIEQLLGLPKSQLLFDLAGAMGDGNVKAVLNQANAIVQSGLSVDSLIVAYVDHLRNLLILRTCGEDSTLVEVPGIAMKDLMAQANRFDPAALAQDITILEELRRTLRQSQAGRALLDATLVRLTLADQFASIPELLNRLEGASSTPRPAARSAPAGEPEQKKNGEAVGGGMGVSPMALTSGGSHEAPDIAVGSAPRTIGSSASGDQTTASTAGHGRDAHATVTPDSLSPALPGNPQSEIGSGRPGSPGEMTASPDAIPTSGDTSTLDAPAASHESSPEDDGDALPAVGKVWEGSGESLSSLMAKHNATVAPSSAPAENATNVEAVNPADLGTVWRSMLDILSSQSNQAMLHSVVAQGELVAIEDGRVVIRFGAKQETFVQTWEKNGKRDIIREAASKAMNKPIGVKFEIAPAPVAATAPAVVKTIGPRHSPAPRAMPAEAAPMPVDNSIKVTNELVDALARDNPLIKSVMRQLGGQVIKVE